MNAPLPSPDLKPHKLTITELLAFERSGAFEGLPRMELLDGTLYEMSPQTSPHVRIRNRLTFRLQTRLLELGLSLEALSEPTITIGANHAPEPDVIVCNMPETDGYYPQDSVLLAVKVSVTSLKSDLGFKKALYASAGIPEYWVIDVEGGRLHQFWVSQGETYAQQATTDLPADIVCQTIDGLTVSGVDLA